ncbi:MAG: hypothetical protein M1834_007717 [Cirrosporium novae-zelandiae]|nr:MAG: hypothetical protein M1834_007717 [Cirrosporium novae-zelandiae]
MRRSIRGGGTAFAHKTNGTNTSDSLRTFISETTPTRPARPSPLAGSQFNGIPLDLLDRIRSFPLFKSAPESFLAAIGAHLRPQVHSPRDDILTEGDDAKAMYWLVRGACAVTSRDGESIYAELKPGAFFGEIGVLMGIPRTANILARTRCLSVVLKKEDLMKELPKFPEVERTIREEAMERLAILERKKEESRNPKTTNTVPVRSGFKRSRDSSPDGIAGGGLEAGRDRGAVKKRKSPSPTLADIAASSALGSGTVNVRQLLKEFPLFSSLPAEILHFLGLNAQPRTYPPFTDIIHQDSTGREVYFIVRGEVEVITAPSNLASPPATPTTQDTQRTHYIKARLKQGQYFGEVASLSLAPRRTATVRSVTMVECLMLDGDVLTEFWSRCPSPIREQVESTAKERLESSSDGDTDMIMTDIKMGSDSTPAISELVIGGASKTTQTGTLPTVTFTYDKSSNLTPPLSDDLSVSEPSDPDPFLNVDLDNIRSRSRRSSLAPPSPDSPLSLSDGERSPSPGSRSPTRSKHVPPSLAAATMRARILKRRSIRSEKHTLSDEILLNIFKHLDVYQLMRLRAVSAHWSHLLNRSDKILHSLDLSKYNRKVTDDALINYIIPFVGSRPRFIDISNCFHLTDEGFIALASQCGKNVTCWKMKSVWDITAVAILEMANNAKGLQHVDLSNCRKVSDNLMIRIVGYVVPNSPPQKSQQLPSKLKVDTKAKKPAEIQPAPGTVMGCPGLKSLTLSYCKHVTDRFMQHLALSAASRMEHIDLTRCTTITDLGFQFWGNVQFINLRRLCLADCTYLTDNAIVYLTNTAKGLQELDLSFCCALSDTATEVLALGCPQLTHLNLSFCGSAVSDPSLRSIGLHLVQLRKLSVRGCVRVTGIGVDAVVEGCQKLEDFDVSQCKNLARWLNLGGPSKWPRVKFETVAGEGKSHR